MEVIKTHRILIDGIPHTVTVIKHNRRVSICGGCKFYKNNKAFCCGGKDIAIDTKNGKNFTCSGLLSDIPNWEGITVEVTKDVNHSTSLRVLSDEEQFLINLLL